MVRYGRQRNDIVQDLTGLETKTSMKGSKRENRFETSFQQPKTGFPKNSISIPNDKPV